MLSSGFLWCVELLASHGDPPWDATYRDQGEPLASEHCAKHLGRVTKGWSCDRCRKLKIPWFPETPIQNVKTLRSEMCFFVPRVGRSKKTSLLWKMPQVDGITFKMLQTDFVLLLSAQHWVHGIRQRPLHHPWPYTRNMHIQLLQHLSKVEGKVRIPRLREEPSILGKGRAVSG